MTTVASGATYLRETRKVLEMIFRFLPEGPFAVQLPDGTKLFSAEDSSSPRFIINLKRPAALRRMLLPPSELALGEGYIFDDFDIEGDIVAAFSYIDNLKVSKLPLINLLNLMRNLLRLERMGNQVDHSLSVDRFEAFSATGDLNSAERDKQASQFHYDLSNAFYKLWLDENLVYSCGYFEDPGEELGVAQKRKLDVICRKLNLQPGERFLDIGCGFGALLIHAASKYGVHATGISLSEEQTKEGLARISEKKLQNRCNIEICHYENFEADLRYDKVASVGMFEHVGEEKLSSYFNKVRQLLRPGGLFLLQAGSARIDRRHVGHSWMDRLGLGRNAFMQKYSFPDSRLIDIPTILLVAENAGFETRDVESLREHYPLTLNHWLRQLEQNKREAVCVVGEPAYRAWRLMLAGYIHLLEVGQLTEYQSLFAKPILSGDLDIPLARI